MNKLETWTSIDRHESALEQGGRGARGTHGGVLVVGQDHLVGRPQRQLGEDAAQPAALAGLAVLGALRLGLVLLLLVARSLRRLRVGLLVLPGRAR